MTTKFRRFREYLNSTGKLDTPKVDASADTGPTGDKAPKAAQTKGKGWEAQVKSTDKPKPYSTDKKPVGKDFSDHPKGETDGKKWTDTGDKKLVYEPKTPKDFSKEGGAKVASWPKTTKEFLDATQGMSLSEFANSLSDRYAISDMGPEGLPPNSDDPVMATNYVSALAANNNSIMETLVREIKRLGSFDKLVSEVLKHPEAFTEIAHSLSEDVIVSRRLERAINETRVQEVVDAPASETEEGGNKGQPIQAGKQDLKASAPGAKARKNPKSIGDPNNKLDMSDSGVVSTRTSLKPN